MVFLTSLFFFLLEDLIQISALECPQDVPNPSWNPFFPYYTVYRECDDFFDVCCDEGCCPRFTQIHIWFIVSSLSFIIFLCLFALWYCCYKKKSTLQRSALSHDEERVNSLLTLVIPENANDSPPPSYPSTVTNTPTAPPISNPSNIGVMAAPPPSYPVASANENQNVVVTDQNTPANNHESVGSALPPPSYEEATRRTSICK